MGGCHELQCLKSTSLWRLEFNPDLIIYKVYSMRDSQEADLRQASTGKL